MSECIKYFLCAWVILTQGRKKIPCRLEDRKKSKLTVRRKGCDARRALIMLLLFPWKQWWSSFKLWTPPVCLLLLGSSHFNDSSGKHIRSNIFWKSSGKCPDFTACLKNKYKTSVDGKLTWLTWNNWFPYLAAWRQPKMSEAKMNCQIRKASHLWFLKSTTTAVVGL